MNRSIRQGCPVLAIFFKLLMKILLTKMNNTESVKGFEISFTQNKN